METGGNHGEEFIVPWDNFTGYVTMHDISDINHARIRGRVIIKIMDGMRVWFSGIHISVDQYLHFLDPYIATEMCKNF